MPYNNQMKTNILSKINNPKDLKKLSIKQLDDLSNEIRELIINRNSKVGGHLGPNLGIVELTVALHYVFNSPDDKFVFDVSHQCYTHKILTGRKEFLTNGISGYTNKNESEHDHFSVGHTSTSVSLALGLAKARDMLGGEENVIAIIGDGSLTGGQAFEGLNNGTTLKSNFIVIVNDNDMSIWDNIGGINENLKKLRETNGEYECNYFKALGYDYQYIANGNSVAELITALSQIKNISKPIVLHINTKKGNGYKFAEDDRANWHYTGPFDIATGNKGKPSSKHYTSVAINKIIDMINKKEKVVVVNPACSFIREVKNALADNFIDVGIAEQHAVGFVSGLAVGKVRPIGLICSSFIQRAYDQMAQDLCLNNAPATIIVEGAGIVSTDATHVGMYDIPLLSNIPNFIYTAPKNAEELIRLIEWANTVNAPVGIRIPNKEAPELKFNSVNKIELNKFEKLKDGKEIAIIGAGNFFELAEKVYTRLVEFGYSPTLINPRFLSSVDESMLVGLTKEHKIVVTLEDGMLDGGFGEKISRFYADKNIKVYNFGANKEFVGKIPYDELTKRYRLRVEDIVSVIIK